MALHDSTKALRIFGRRRFICFFSLSFLQVRTPISTAELINPG